MESVERDAWPELEPDRLPDAGGLFIPAAEVVGHPALLAAWELAVGAVCGAQGQAVGTGLEQGADVEGEAVVAATVVAGQVAVDPDLAFVVDAFKVQDNRVLRCELVWVDRDRAFVPDDRVVCGIADTGGGGLIAVGDADAVVI